MKQLIKQARELYLLQVCNIINECLLYDKELRAEVNCGRVIIRKGYWERLAAEDIKKIKVICDVELDTIDDECCGTLYSYIVKL